LGGSGFEASLGKKLARPHLDKTNLGTMMHTYHPSYVGTQIGGSQSEADKKKDPT
jgi:hypothetical protein